MPPIEDNDIVEIKVNTNPTSSIFSNPCETCNYKKIISCVFKYVCIIKKYFFASL